MHVATQAPRPARSIKLRDLDRDTFICETWDVTDPVSQARAALDRAEGAVERRRKELAAAVADAVRSGERLASVGARARYTPEHVRRIARAHGIEATVLREPPKPRRRTPAES